MSLERKTTPLLYLGFLSAFSLFSFDLYQPALPAITSYFNTTPAIGQLTLSLFFLAYGLSQLFWGPLVDHYGRNYILRFSQAIFLLATIGCIYATTIELLIAARILQGFAVCCSNIISFSSARDYEDSTERARVMSYLSMIMSVSPILAPLVGSIIFLHYDWQANFFVLGLIAVFLFASSYLLLQEAPHWKKSEHFFSIHDSIAAYKKAANDRFLILGTLIVAATYSCVMLIVINSAYLIVGNLHCSPIFFSILFALNGSMLIIGNFIGIKLRQKQQSLLWSIRFGSMLMVNSTVIMILIFSIKGLNLFYFAPILFISLSISIINPPTFSLVLTNYKKHAATAMALINTIRMTLASIIGGVAGIFITDYPLLLSLGLMVCALICLMTSQLLKEPYTMDN